MENGSGSKDVREAKRTDVLCGYLDKCATLADIGCDHGYCTLAALKAHKCERAIVTDISEKCLAKAQKLLSRYIDEGKVAALCTDGLKGIDEDVSQVLIAGMGGMEIIRIFRESFIPKKFVLQPMRNCRELREFLLGNGCRFRADDIFRCKDKYYFVICGERGGGESAYSEKQLQFGRDSLSDPIFQDYLKQEIARKEARLAENEGRNTAQLVQSIDKLKEVLK